MKAVTQKATGLLVALLMEGAAASYAGPASGYTLVSGSGNITSIQSLAAHPTNRGVLVSGAVHRSLGLGSSGGGYVCVSVTSPNGTVSSKAVRVSFPNRRPIVYSRNGSFTTTVQAEPGSTIRVTNGCCPQC